LLRTVYGYNMVFVGTVFAIVDIDVVLKRVSAFGHTWKMHAVTMLKIRQLTIHPLHENKAV